MDVYEEELAEMSTAFAPAPAPDSEVNFDDFADIDLQVFSIMSYDATKVLEEAAAWDLLDDDDSANAPAPAPTSSFDEFY